MIINVSHNLAKNEAKERIKKVIEDLKKDYGNIVKNPQEKWNQDSTTINFHAYNLSFEGIIEFKESQVKIDFKVPFFAKVFEGRIRSEIVTHLKKSLT
jgi:predicted transcriptional regulator